MITALLAYAPFFDPLPIWDRNWFWALLLVPLCAAVAVVYKSIRCSRMSQVPRESLVLFITIVVGMIVAAAALAGIAAMME
jgi:hypothetical protein